jgi:hypothetical protein
LAAQAKAIETLQIEAYQNEVELAFGGPDHRVVRIGLHFDPVILRESSREPVERARDGRRR